MSNISLKVTSAFLVGGKIAKMDDVVEVSSADAKDLLNRGKAVLAEGKACIETRTEPKADEKPTDEKPKAKKDK